MKVEQPTSRTPPEVLPAEYESPFGPRLDLGVSHGIYPAPHRAVPLSFGQRVAADGWRPTFDRSLASVAGLKERWTSSIDLERTLANIKAGNPVLPEETRNAEHSYADSLTVLRFLARVAGGAVENGATFLRAFTNPIIGKHIGQVALSAPVHPYDTATSIANAAWDHLISDEPIENKLADLAPSPTSLLKGASLLGYVKWEGLHLPKHKEYDSAVGMHPESGEEVAAGVKQALERFVDPARPPDAFGMADMEGKFVFAFGPEGPAFAFSAEGSVHKNLAIQLGVEKPDVQKLDLGFRQRSKFIAGGRISRGPDGRLRSDESSTGYAGAWTPAVRQEYVDFMRSKGIEIDHKPTWDPRYQ